MGKSRLLYELRQRIGKERAFFLTGSCSPDGQQTPFLPFIEVVRGSFRLGAGEAEKEIAQKLGPSASAPARRRRKLRKSWRWDWRRWVSSHSAISASCCICSA